jgi:protease I
MKLKGQSIAVFVADLYEDLEFWYPALRMEEEGAEVTSIGPRAETYRGKRGLSARADRGIADVSPDQFSALIIPGGYSPDQMRRYREMVEFVRDMD